ncbi:hypothetical protein [Microbacterium gorillae]|uniref:hypothetical protein n=1 Tax=Microbacterium gorillae TaxID=1231063 RepID=UPI003D97BF75
MLPGLDAVNFEPLTRPLDAAAVRESERRSGVSRLGGVAATGCAVLVVIVLGLLFAGCFALGTLSGGSPWWWLPSGVVLVPTLLLVVWLVRREVHSFRTGPETRWRLAEFYAANEVEPIAEMPDPLYRRYLLVDDSLPSPRLLNVSRWCDGAVEVGRILHTLPGRNGMHTVKNCAYVRIPLGSSGLDFVLDAGAKNAPWQGGTLTTVGHIRESAELEAANGTRFTLWTWRQDLTRATALMDPELLELLSRFTADLVIRDGLAQLMWNTPLQFADEARWRWIFEVAGALRARLG